MIQVWPQSQHPAAYMLELLLSQEKLGAGGDLHDTGGLCNGNGEQRVPNPSPQQLSGNTRHRVGYRAGCTVQLP